MSKYIVALDLGGTVVKLGIFNFQDKLIKSSTFLTNSYPAKKSLIEAICNSINKLIKEEKINKKDVKAIGMGLPGPVNSDKGFVYYFPNIPGWKNTPIKRILEKKLNIPVFVDNDVNLMTLAEFQCGSGLGANNLMCMTLGTGVGGGLVLDGKLFRGSSLVAGEVGHIPISLEGRKCNCGGKDCLESYVGNQVVLKEAKKYFGSKITLKLLDQKAAKGDTRAIKIWQGVGNMIGTALVGVVNLLNLERIIIGGGVAKAGKILFDAIRNTIKQNAMPVQAKAVKVFRAKLGYNAGLIGAAIFARTSLEGV